jgi:NADPH:quinone reductase-like Zn-dependent oxidoreductase
MEQLVKAARFSRFGGPEVLEIVDLPDPHPGPGQVRIAVRAAGVNASDWKQRQGLFDQDLPQTMGYEAAGIVDELGDAVTDAVIGDSVSGSPLTVPRRPNWPCCPITHRSRPRLTSPRFPALPRRRICRLR